MNLSNNDTTLLEWRFSAMDDPALRKIITYIPLSAVPFHISHIVMIILQQELHQNAYAFVLNLAMSDLCHTGSMILLKNLPGYFRYVKIGNVFSYIASILFTLAITVDRYMKIEYVLRYEDIVTKKRVGKWIVCIWLFSLLSSSSSLCYTQYSCYSDSVPSVWFFLSLQQCGSNTCAINTCRRFVNVIYTLECMVKYTVY